MHPSPTRFGYSAAQRLGLALLLLFLLLSGLVLNRVDFVRTETDGAAAALAAQLRLREARLLKPAPESFRFNPNVVTSGQLLRLGLSEQQAASFLRYRGDRPNAFLKLEDFTGLRLLRQDQRDRLAGLVDIPASNSAGAPRTERFAFDPNTVTDDELRRLGLREYQVRAWNKYRAKVPFRDANQLGKLRFLDAPQREKLAGLARFPAPELHERFPFDPNTISADSFQLLGFPAYAAEALLRYRAGRELTFRKPTDLLRVRALDSQLVRLALPLVRMKGGTRPDAAPTPPPRIYDRAPLPAPASVDLNTADTSLLKTLPGIGSYRAGRLVRYRDALGGFANLEQAARTRGIPDSTWREVLPYLRLSPVYRQISINRASVVELKKHPAINSKLAATVVSFRDRHGPFSGAADLHRIRILTDDKLAEILPYLSFE